MPPLLALNRSSISRFVWCLSWLCFSGELIHDLPFWSGSFGFRTQNQQEAMSLTRWTRLYHAPSIGQPGIVLVLQRVVKSKKDLRWTIIHDPDSDVDSDTGEAGRPTTALYKEEHELLRAAPLSMQQEVSHFRREQVESRMSIPRRDAPRVLSNIGQL